MKITQRYLRQLIREALRAEAEEAADDAPEEAPPADDAGTEEPPAADTGAEQGEEGAEGPKPEDLTIKFNISRVKNYNREKFASNVGMVKKVTPHGLIVTTQPDNVDVVVNFEDITESKEADLLLGQSKKFFKNRG